MTRPYRRDLPCKILAALEARRGEWVTVAELVEALYGDREDGGAEAACVVVRYAVHRLRRRGVPVEHAGVYRLPPRRDQG